LTRIVVVDDHPLLAHGLRVELERCGAEVDLADAGAGAERILAVVEAADPDCVVLDLGLPFPGGGHALVRPLAGRGARVAVLTGETDRSAWSMAAGAGARVVISKSEPIGEIVEAVLQVADGADVRPSIRARLVDEHRQAMEDRERSHQPFEALTAREQEILEALVCGHSPNRIAERDIVSIETVRSQVKSVLRKLGVSSQLEAVALANRRNWRLSQPAH
jgi:two-component system, NarL family, nitrate/nitrite response regulator NarL